MFFPFGRSIDARERMLRVAKARLESIAPADEVGLGRPPLCSHIRAAVTGDTTCHESVGLGLVWEDRLCAVPSERRRLERVAPLLAEVEASRGWLSANLPAG